MIVNFNVARMNGAVFVEKSQVLYILRFLPKTFLQFHSNVEMNKMEYNMTTLLKELQIFQSLKGHKEGEANVAHSRRFAPSSTRSKKIQKRKEGKGKGPTVAAKGKGKAKVAIKGKCFHCNVMDIGKETAPSTLLRRKKRKETSSFKQLEEDEMTLKGCPAHVLVTNPKKLEPRSRLCQFVDYPKETRGDLFFDPQENRVFILTNATFLEEDHVRDYKPRSKLVLNEDTDGSTRVVDEVGPSPRVDETTTSGQSHPSQFLRMPRCSVRVVLQPNHYLGLTKTQVFIPDNSIEDPLSYKQAMNDVDKDQWVKAMDLEMESMYFNSVWELVDLPEGVKPIGCKLIYKRKRDSVGKSIRILLSIATFYDYEIWQMDVKTAFLNGNLEKSIFMSQLEGFITQGKSKKHGVPLSKEQCPKTPQEVEDMRRIPYASAVGSLMYLMLCTRPDICYAVGIVSRRTRDYMLVYEAKDLILIGYTDSDFQTDSTMEVEYVAACEAAKEAVWLRKLPHYLEVVPNMNLPITLYCDNSGTVANSKEPRSHKRGKHIERKYHLIREIVQRGDVIVTKIASKHNIVDPFTKTLTTQVFEGHLESLGLRDIYIR
ncbi:gag/pol protein [Cucumis melo var. makuwa]|uniref:Gag/pol protein n=1 Tax=Cucumis melo var. makuwa TaxID=1194695 RepID=A0A5D3DA15_CUCMM|nr:gag/pol protein [Cucumis melo var. makuwa]TYK20411.1 gag/pol protein [Cucumis melo var. makuwa]